MAFLDIERVINQDNIGSRFKLVYIAGSRARELNSPNDDTVLPTLKPGQKVTSKALSDIVHNKITFSETITNEDGTETVIEHKNNA